MNVFVLAASPPFVLAAVLFAMPAASSADLLSAAPGMESLSVPMGESPAAFTFAAEFRTLETPAQIAIPGYVASAGTSTTNGFSLRLQSTAGGRYDLQFSLARKGGGASWIVGSGGAVTPGRWCRVVARWDGAKMTLDADGKRIGETSYSGPFVPAADGLLSVNRTAIGYTYYPLEVPVAAYAPRAWSGDETAAFFAGRRKDDPRAERLAAALDLARKGDFSGMGTGDAPEIPLHPMTLAKWREGAAFSRLSAGDVQGACRLARRRMAQAPDFSEPDGRLDFVPVFAKALAAKGERMLATQMLEDIRRSSLMAGDLSAAPLVGLDLSDALASSGRDYDAECERDEALALARGTRIADVVSPEAAKPGAGQESAASGSRGAFVFVVSPDGDDANPGTPERPFRSIERARAAAREKGGATVYLRSGTYVVRETFALGPEDSGSTWRAWKDEKPILTGAAPVGPLAPVSDPAALARIAPEAREHVRVADLSGVGGLSFRPMPVFGFGTKRRPAPVVIEAGEALQIAIHPNEGFLRVKAPKGSVRGLMTEQGFQQRGEASMPKNGFYSDDPSLARFAGAKDLMVRGYWTWYWADLMSRVASVDPVSGAVVMSVSEADEEPRVKRVANAEPGNPFWFMNALEALDAPGEWYIDGSEKKLYVWPRREGDALRVSVAQSNLVEAAAVRDLELRGIAFDGGSLGALVLAGCTNVVVSGCSFRGFGSIAVSIRDGLGVTLADSVVADTGRTALDVRGGDRATLSPSRHRIAGCEFARNSCYGRVHPTILVDGVGVEITGCFMHDAPSSVVRLEGNDHLVASNRFVRAVYECDDNAAIDIYRNPSYAGCRFIGNVFEDCGRAGGFADCGQAAIRFDGNISGMTVAGNVFRRCGTAFFGAININGGRMNVVDSNVFEDCEKGVTVFFYPDWHWRYIWRGGNHHAVFIREECFDRLGIRGGIYAERYPRMAALPELPQVNFITRNRGIGCPVYDRLPPATAIYGNSAEATP